MTSMIPDDWHTGLYVVSEYFETGFKYSTGSNQLNISKCKPRNIRIWDMSGVLPPP
jgi:hypothetical protein